MKISSFLSSKKFKSIISISIIIISLLLLAYYLYTHISDFAALKLVNPLYIIPLILLFVLGIFLNGISLNALMKPFKIKLGLFESFGIACITNFYNMITPFRGGMAARAVYLKQKHKFPYTDFLATLSAVYIIVFLAGTFAGLLSIFFIWLYYQTFNLLIFLAFLIFFLFLLSIVIFSPKIPDAKNSFLNRIIRVINGWHLIRKNKRIILTITSVSILQLIIGSCIFMITYNIFGVDIGFFKALFLTSIGSIAILVAITPGNLGIGDAISIFSASLIGIGITQAVAVAILTRVINLISILILGPIFSYILLKHNPEIEKKKENNMKKRI